MAMLWQLPIPNVKSARQSAKRGKNLIAVREEPSIVRVWCAAC